MPRNLTPTTIRNYGAEVANVGVPDGRAAEIAPEVEALNNAVLEAATRLDLNDEPGQFALALVRNRQPRGKTR
jgi:hypothetical protein